MERNLQQNIQNSICLRQLAVTMLNTPDAPLAVAHGVMAKLFKAKATVLVLSEPHGDDAINAVTIRNGHADMSASGDGTADFPQELVRQVRQKNQLNMPAEEGTDQISASPEGRHAGRICEAGYLGIPMSCSQAEQFGVIVLATEDTGWDAEKEKAVSAFCETVYADLMGAFLKSSREIVMKVREVCVRYGSSEHSPSAVDRVSLDIRAGELTVIMGRSGCGKSSLLNVMAAILTPSSGKVLWHGKNICSMSAREKNAYRREALGFIFQNYNLISALTAAENVAVSAILSGTERLVDSTLALVELSGKENRYPGELSGGEQQRVSIARALVKNAALLLCDEPTGALDSENGKLVMCLLQRIAWKKKIPVVVVTHNADYAVLADHYISMKDGRIEQDLYRCFPRMAESCL